MKINRQHSCEKTTKLKIVNQISDDFIKKEIVNKYINQKGNNENKTDEINKYKTEQNKNKMCTKLNTSSSSTQTLTFSRGRIQL